MGVPSRWDSAPGNPVRVELFPVRLRVIPVRLGYLRRSLPPCQARDAPVSRPRTGSFSSRRRCRACSRSGSSRSASSAEQVVIGSVAAGGVAGVGGALSCSGVHGSPSSGQVVGQLLGGSQVSPAPTRPSPHFGAQSLSVVGRAGRRAATVVRDAAGDRRVAARSRAPLGRPRRQVERAGVAVIAGARAGARLAAVIARSQFSLVSTTPSPQMGGQSLSSTAVHPGGQQRSPPTQAVTGVATHAALQLFAPCRSRRRWCRRRSD